MQKGFSNNHTYRKEIKKTKSYRDDIFVLDILREEMSNDDPRIQRILYYSVSTLYGAWKSRSFDRLCLHELKSVIQLYSAFNISR